MSMIAVRSSSVFVISRLACRNHCHCWTYGLLHGLGSTCSITVSTTLDKAVVIIVFWKADVTHRTFFEHFKEMNPDGARVFMPATQTFALQPLCRVIPCSTWQPG